jgi:hypothetical protein
LDHFGGFPIAMLAMPSRWVGQCHIVFIYTLCFLSFQFSECNFWSLFWNLYDINESQLFSCTFHTHVHVLHHLL